MLMASTDSSSGFSTSAPVAEIPLPNRMARFWAGRQRDYTGWIVKHTDLRIYHAKGQTFHPPTKKATPRKQKQQRA
jgi:hypothetical protein